MPLAYPEIYPRLTISIDGVATVLKNDNIISYSRNPQSFLAVNRSNIGSIVFSGYSYESPEEFNLSIKANEDIYQSLVAIFKISEYKAKTPPREDFEILIEDICKPVIQVEQTFEPALVWEEVLGVTTKYFAKFKTVFTNFTAVPNGTGYDIEITAVQV